MLIDVIPYSEFNHFKQFYNIFSLVNWSVILQIQQNVLNIR